MKIAQATLLLFFATNVACFGLHRLFGDLFNPRTGSITHHSRTLDIQNSGASLMDAMLWDELGDSGSSEEGGLFYLFHMLNNYDTGDYPVNFETTTFKPPQSTIGTNIDDTKPIKTTETPTKSTTEITTNKPRTSTTIQPAVTTESTTVDSTTTRTSEEMTESSETPMETTTQPVVTEDNVTQTASSERFTTSTSASTTTQTASSESFTTSTSASTTTQTASSESFTTSTSPSTTTQTASSESSTHLMASTTTPYSITTEDTFIEGDLTGDEKVNKTELNSTDDITKIIDEYNDYIDEGPTRGDLHSNKNKGLHTSSDATPTTGGSGIIDEYLSSLKKTNDINSTKESTGKDQKSTIVADISVQNIGNIPFDQAIQSLNNNPQLGLGDRQNILSGISVAAVDNTLKNDVTATLPKPTVFFTPPSSQVMEMSKSQQKLFSERVARIGNDFVILPDFNNGAVLLEPIISSGNIKTNTIPNFEYVPPKTLSFEEIPNTV
uniref:Zonadhesin n=1 Tax=Magallana gigas TaxID=29159 RepID=K1PRI5_MAGGI|eukprot:XP_011437330.1 PREDICTED: uncharacterized protein LOC105335232 [Crassostrea gigas]